MSSSGSSLSELLDALCEGLRRSALAVKCLILLMLICWGVVAVLAVGVFSYRAAVVFAGAAVLFASLWLMRRRFFCLPGPAEAGKLLDDKLQTKNRVVSYLSLSAPSVRDSDPLWREKQELLERQLLPHLTRDRVAELSRLRLAAGLRRGLYSLPLSWVLGGLLLFRFYAAAPAAARVQAEAVARLLDEHPALPAELKDELRELAAVLGEHQLTSAEVSRALERAEAELAESRLQLGAGEGSLELEAPGGTAERGQASATPSPRPSQAAPSPVPTPARREGAEEKNKPPESKDQRGEAQQPKEGKQGSQGQSPAEKSKDQQDGGSQGQGRGQGREGASDQPQQQAGGNQSGSGQGSSGASEKENQGDGAGKGGRDEGGQREGPGQKQAAQAGAQGGGDKQEGRERSQAEGLSKVEQTLSQLEQKIEKEKSEQPKSGDQGDQEQESLGAGKAEGQAESRDAKEKGQAKEGTGEREPGAGKQKKPQSENAGTDESDSQRQAEAKDREGFAPSASKRQGAFLKEDGRRSKGLQGEKEFQNVAVPEQGEKYDPRFVGDESDLKQGERGANYKVELKDVQLAKPETVKERGEQRIPLEYKEVLE